MPNGFSQVLASIEPCAGPGFAVTVPPDWLQGRTVFGGLQMALGGRAMRAVLPLQAAAMPLRSAQMTFVGPLLGGAPIRMKAETLRAGKSTVHARCDLMHDDGKVACTVVGIFGKVIDPQTKAGDWVELKHLIEAGLLAPGDTLVATHRDFKGRQATLTAEGAIDLDGKRYTSPSAAGHALRKRATNGWYFWAVADGRRLRDVRTEFQNSMPADENLEFAE